jgi:hypothetical protein
MARWNPLKQFRHYLSNRSDRGKEKHGSGDKDPGKDDPGFKIEANASLWDRAYNNLNQKKPQLVEKFDQLLIELYPGTCTCIIHPKWAE